MSHWKEHELCSRMSKVLCVYVFFFLIHFFGAVSHLQKNWARGAENSCILFHTAFPLYSLVLVWYVSVVFLMRQYWYSTYAKSRVFIRAHWVRPFSELRQMCHDVCLRCRAAVLLFCSPASHLFIPHFLPWSPGNHWSFYCLSSSAFSRMSWNWNNSVCSLFRLFSLSNMHLMFVCVFSWLPLLPN